MRTSTKVQIHLIAKDFERDYADVLSTPEERCFYLSTHFAKRLSAFGIKCDVISGVKQEGNLILCGHFAVQVYGLVWDWTARQFDPAAPVPRVVSIERWRQEWPTIR